MVEKSIVNSIRYGREQEVRQWLKTHRDTEELSRLLLKAAYSPNQNGEIIEMLLASGADPNYVDETGYYYPQGPSLSVAASFGCMETVKLLIEAGADPYIKDRGDETPLDTASDESIKLILLGKTP